jgi:2-polyprenyl-3-methyl-5-hydroxy-6-metoxy-1,4-benzoquinol methylase
VDLNRFKFKVRTPGYNVAYLGYLHHRKNPSLLLQCMHALVQENEHYHLHIAGYFQQPVWEYYFNHMLERLGLESNVTMHGWVEDVPSWLDDKQYLVLPTIHEGNPYSVLEAAAQGIKPLVHNFPGAEELYPTSWRFNSVPEFVNQVLHHDYDSRSYRQHVAEHYSLAQQTKKIDELLQELAATDVNTNDYVQSYYDNWDDRLVADYKRGNPRVLGGIEYVLNQIPQSASRILDIGCGIGWSTWEIKRHFPEAEVVGVDISPQLIETANTLFGAETGLTFDTCDVTEDTPPEGPYDAIAMIDVYEHIPRDSRSVFHQALSQLLKSDGKLILTCPTPHLQRYLAANAPHKLQPVDEIIRDSDLETLLDDIDGATYEKQTVSIWLEGDYFHATLNRSGSSSPAISNVNLEGENVRTARLNFAPHLQNRSTLVKPEGRPVFVLGNQKSGTTAIASLLADHTESTASLDIQDFELLEHTYPALIQGDITTKAFETLHAPFFSKKVIKECLLTTVFDDLRALHPDAKFVFIVRDPRDNIRSILDRFRIPGDRDAVDWPQLSLPPLWAYVFGLKWRPLEGTNYIDMLASRWNEVVDIYLRNKNSFTLVRYEDFLTGKESSTVNLAKSIGLESVTDISQKVDKQYQPRGANRDLDWKEFFSGRNLDLIHDRCQEGMNKLGYDIDF